MGNYISNHNYPNIKNIIVKRAYHTVKKSYPKIVKKIYQEVHKVLPIVTNIYHTKTYTEMKIEIRDNIPDEIAIELVGIVIRQGRISEGKDRMYYCWLTKISYKDEEYTVYVRDNRKNDCFVVCKS